MTDSGLPACLVLSHRVHPFDQSPNIATSCPRRAACTAAALLGGLVWVDSFSGLMGLAVPSSVPCGTRASTCQFVCWCLCTCLTVVIKHMVKQSYQWSRESVWQLSGRKSMIMFSHWNSIFFLHVLIRIRVGFIEAFLSKFVHAEQEIWLWFFSSFANKTE